MTDLRQALEHLGAEPAGRGYYSYVSDEEGRPIRYTLDSADWRDLGRRLRLAEPDAYSRWCAGTMPERALAAE